jgi:hypothetical protein
LLGIRVAPGMPSRRINFRPYYEENIEIAEQTGIPYGSNHFCSAVRLIQVRQVGAPRDDTVRVDSGVAGKVMGLNMIKVHRGSDAGHLVQLASVGSQVRILLQHVEIRLEMQNVHGIEPDQCRKQSDVSQRQLISA